MAETDPPKDQDAPPHAAADEAPPVDPPRERVDRGISDFLKRAVSAGIEAASKSKDYFERDATTEIRSWLDRLELDTELRKALSKMVLEVKAEIRFRPIEGDGKETKMAVEAQTDFKARRER